MKRFLCFCVLAAASLTIGCQSFNTGIHQNGPDTYTITRLHQGFLRIYGSVYACQANGNSMNCQKIGGE